MQTPSMRASCANPAFITSFNLQLSRNLGQHGYGGAHHEYIANVAHGANVESIIVGFSPDLEIICSIDLCLLLAFMLGPFCLMLDHPLMLDA